MQFHFKNGIRYQKKYNMENVQKKITKGMLYILVANGLTMLANTIISFLLPKLLSVDTYANIKTYQLYMNYVGVFHLGFVDGIYLKYGGLNISDVPKKELAEALCSIHIFQLAMCILVSAYAIVQGDYIVLAFGIAIVPVNISGFFKMLFQAVGEFGQYSKIINAATLLTFVANVFLCLLIKTDYYLWYLVSYLCVDLFVWIVLEVKAKQSLKINNSCCDLKVVILKIKENIFSGFSLMCGNLASFILTGMDRWFVKFTLETFYFAQYSFAVSLENMLNLLITPVTVPLYNYFCTEKKDDKVRFVHSVLSVFSSCILCLGYISAIMIDLILPNYREAKPIMIILFAASGIQIVVKGIYINLYKVHKEQKKYFIKLLVVLVSGVLFNLILFNLLHNMISYAIGTLLAAILWLSISLWDFWNIVRKVDIVYIIFEIISFLVCGLFFDSMIGFGIYILISILFTIVLMNSCLKKIRRLLHKISIKQNMKRFFAK